jgi:hypothetical protein
MDTVQRFSISRNTLMRLSRSTVAVRLLELPSTVLYLTVRRLISKDVFGGGFSSCGLHYPDGQGSLPLHDYGHGMARDCELPVRPTFIINWTKAVR